MGIFKRALRFSFNALLSRDQRRKLGSFLTNEANGDNDDNPCTNGEYELLKNFLQLNRTAPCTALDIGANIGEWTCEYLKYAPSGSRVFCFEPTPTTFKKLNENMTSNKNATTVNCALGDQPGEASLHIAGELAGTNSLHRRTASYIEVTSNVKVTVSTGDDFCATNGIEKIDFIKIDTEGHEVAVIRGLDRMLSQKRVRMIQFEYGGAWLDARVQLSDVFAIFQSKGYLVAKIFPHGLRIYDKYEQRLDSFAHANFVALLPELRNSFAAVK